MTAGKNSTHAPMKDLLLLSSLLALAAGFSAAPSPYAGEQLRDVKALSPGEISGYLAGRGMGLARPAELNGYPGPRHVLDAAVELKLTGTQVAALQRCFEEMQAAAVPLGRKLVDRETELDRMFADHKATAPALENLTREIGRLQGELRAVHLRAHLQTRPLLTPEQVAAYNRVRGYDARPANPRGAKP